MKPSNNICEYKNVKSFNSVVTKEQEICYNQSTTSNIQQWSKYLLKVGAASALTFSICNIEYNSSNYHYSESITFQETNKIGVNNHLLNTPIIDNVNIEQEIIYAATELENLKPIPPKKSFKIKGKINRITKGSVSRA